MANISSASGKIILKGDWTKKAIDAFKPVLDLWSFHGYYGISDLSGELDEDHLSVGFWGNGRWSFSGTLELFEIWARGGLINSRRIQMVSLKKILQRNSMIGFLR